MSAIEDPEIVVDTGTLLRRKALYYLFAVALILYVIVPNVSNPA